MIEILYNDKIYIYEDKDENINVLAKKEKDLVKISYIKEDKRINEEILVAGINYEFDIFKDKDYKLYLIYQDRDSYLNFLSYKDLDKEEMKLTNEPVSNALYLSLYVDKDIYHIFYYSLIEAEGLKYRLYHHIYKDSKWSTYIVDEFNIEILKPIILTRGDNKLYLTYHKWDGKEDIFICEYDLENPLWGSIKKLTNDDSMKLNYDIIYKDGKLHLTYTKEKEGNFLIVYERFSIEDGGIINELKDEITSPSHNDYPTLVFYQDLLWLSWTNYGNIQSVYSKDLGFSWSKIVNWEEYKGKEIVRYNYLDKYKNKAIYFNKAFGLIKEDIQFIGFQHKDNLDNLNYVKDVNKIDTFKEDDGKKEKEEEYLVEKIVKLRKEISLLEDKIDHIEKFLSQRARGYRIKE